MSEKSPEEGNIVVATQGEKISISGLITCAGVVVRGNIDKVRPKILIAGHFNEPIMVDQDTNELNREGRYFLDVIKKEMEYNDLVFGEKTELLCLYDETHPSPDERIQLCYKIAEHLGTTSTNQPVSGKWTDYTEPTITPYIPPGLRKSKLSFNTEYQHGYIDGLTYALDKLGQN